MTELTLYAHPFAAYCWKVLIALYENGTPFRYRVLDNDTAVAELAELWPIKKFPVLRDGEASIIESSVIIEHLLLRHPGPVRLIPEGVDAALEARFMDRFFDNYVMAPMQKLVLDRMRADGEHDPKGVAEARTLLDGAYGWLDEKMARRTWSAGRDFTIGDCAAVPALFYADWVHPIADRFAAVRAYRSRVLARPSVVRVIDEARPFRAMFPGGAPDRD
jgi:glutathione S-transferase